MAIDERLFTWPSDDPRLIGSRCADCCDGDVPDPRRLPALQLRRHGDDRAPRRGTLWTYTTQGFRPKSPPEGSYLGDDTDETFEPYALGYVELADHCKVESRLTGAQLDGFSIGMEMELAIIPFRKDESGNDVMTFAFRPVKS